MKSFNNKVAVITGGGEGIGRAMALEFVASGATIIINDIDQGKLNETRELLNSSKNRCICYKADVSNSDEVNAFANFVNRKYKKIDLLINNAGVSIGRINAVDIPRDISEWIFGVNYWGTVNCVNSFRSLLRSHDGAKIVNICSLYSYVSVYKRSAYCASKAALKAYSASLRQELKSEGIKVVSVFPGMVSSHIVQNSRGWYSELEKHKAQTLQNKLSSLSTTAASHKILRGIEKNRQRILVGRDAKLIFQLLRFLPKFGEDLVNQIVSRAESRLKKKYTLSNV